MKRTIAAGLSAALLCGMVVPAFAADTKTATNTTGTTQLIVTAPDTVAMSEEIDRLVAIGIPVVTCGLDVQVSRRRIISTEHGQIRPDCRRTACTVR